MQVPSNLRCAHKESKECELFDRCNSILNVVKFQISMLKV